MRIATIVSEFPPNVVGGLGTYASGIYPAMTRFGHEVSVITFNGEGSGSFPCREIIDGVRVFRPPMTKIPRIFPVLLSEEWRAWGGGTILLGNVLFNNIISAAHFVNKNRIDSKHDVFAAHDWLGAPGGMMVKENTGLPVVFHVHSDEYGRNFGYPFQPLAQIEREFAEIADMIVTVSHPMAEHLANIGFDRNKIRVCWNGIDVGRYNPARIDHCECNHLRASYGIHPNEKMLLFIGRLINVKGAEELVQAMAMVDDPKAKLVILGTGPLQGHIEYLISNLGLEDRVKTNFNFIPEDQRIAHLAACDCAVFPSIYEPFGIVSQEAMAMEKPVIVGASGTSGFRDQVVASGGHQTGFHVNGKDPRDIAKWGIEAFLSLSEEEAAYMGQNGRRRVMEYFTWSRIAQNTTQLYQSLI